MRIVVGSESAIKIEAVKSACRRLGLDAEVIGFEADSRINTLPVGFDEIRLGADNRCCQTAENHPDAFCVGIESGVLVSRSVVVDLAMIVIRRPDGTVLFGTSEGIQLPYWAFIEAQKRGFETTTVGMVLVEKHRQGDHHDPHAILTKGEVKRSQVLASAVHLVLARALAR